MLNYFIDVSLYWGLFYGLYYLLLRNETFFGWNRVYLLLALTSGLILPFLPSIEMESAIGPVSYLAPEISVQPGTTVTILADRGIVIGDMLLGIYLLGVSAMAMHIFYSLLKLRQYLSRGSERIVRGLRVIISPGEQTPFSFLNTLVLSEEDWANAQSRQAILLHESEHIRQRHSLDILFLTALQLFFWWHPLLYLYKKSLREIHEFQADKRVMDHYSLEEYGRILLDHATLRPATALSHSFIQSQLKSRFIMMAKNSSSSWNKIKYMLVVPALSLVFFLTNTEQGQAQISGLQKVAEVMPAFPGCSEKEGGERTECTNQKMMAYVMQELKYPEAAAKEKIEGTVYVTFVVSKDGKIINSRVIKGISPSLDEEALRVVKAMGVKPWSPGEQGGKPVNVEMNLPVKFALNTEKE